MREEEAMERKFELDAQAVAEWQDAHEPRHIGIMKQCRGVLMNLMIILKVVAPQETSGR